MVLKFRYDILPQYVQNLQKRIQIKKKNRNFAFTTQMVFMNLWRDSTQLDNSFLAHQGSEFRENSQRPFITNSDSFSKCNVETNNLQGSLLSSPLAPLKLLLVTPASALQNTPGPQGHASITETGEGSAQTGAYILKD